MVMNVQEEVEQKTFNIVVSTTKLTARTILNAGRTALREYVHSEKDILKLVTTLMTNTKGEGSGGDPFWEKSERLLLTALIAYLHYEAPVEEQNFATLLEMLNTMQVLEDDEEYQNPVDLLFEDWDCGE